jgi:ABC-2 type transport system permease protein
MKTPTFTMPRLNIRRTYLIARRDFVGYIKTWGFWLTTFGPFIGLFLIFLMFLVIGKSDPVNYAVILDETNHHGAKIELRVKQKYADDLEEAVTRFSRITVPKQHHAEFSEILKAEGPVAAQNFAMEKNPAIARYIEIPEASLVILPPPVNDIDGLKDYVSGKKSVTVKGVPVELNGVLHLYEKDGELQSDYWTASPNSSEMETLTNSYFATLQQDNYLAAAGLSREGLRTARADALRVDRFNPKKSVSGKNGQAITFEDSLPYIVASVLTMLLWLTIFTGAYMLLVSMVEEKINKVLEMLLATTRFSEIFVGKLLGVALLTMTSMLPWLLIGTLSFYGILNLGDASVVADFDKAISTKMYIFLPVFLVLGYVFYGSIFIALGAVSESMQDASTLMTPMVLLMTACITIVPIGLNFPESPIVTFGQWFPFSAPFAAIVRLPSDPPLWETLGSALSLILSTVLVVWLSSRLFEHGVLSGSGLAVIKDWFARKILRQSPTK